MTNKLDLGYFVRMVSSENIKVLVGGLIVSSLFLVGCSRTLDGKKVEETILSGITKQGASNLKSVICPANIPPAAGKEFECIGVLDSGNGVSIAVTQQDDQGTVTWNVPSVRGLLNMTTLQSEFEQTLKKEVGQAKVDCGLSVYRLVKPGETFECQLVKREPKSERDSAKTDASDKELSRTVQVTQAAIDKPKTTVPTQAADSKPTEIVQVTVQPSGDVNWQRIIRVSATRVSATRVSATNAAIAASTKNLTASTPDPKANQSDSPKTSAPAAKSAEDFLNQPGAADDFE